MPELHIRKETFLPYSNGWVTPTVEELKVLVRFSGLSGSQIGNTLGVSSRTVRKWLGGESQIPYAAWALLVYILLEKEIWN